jgi:hypothetical protein
MRRSYGLPASKVVLRLRRAADQRRRLRDRSSRAWRSPFAVRPRRGGGSSISERRCLGLNGWSDRRETNFASSRRVNEMRFAAPISAFWRRRLPPWPISPLIWSTRLWASPRCRSASISAGLVSLVDDHGSGPPDHAPAYRAALHDGSAKLDQLAALAGRDDDAFEWAATQDIELPPSYIYNMLLPFGWSISWGDGFQVNNRLPKAPPPPPSRGTFSPAYWPPRVCPIDKTAPSEGLKCPKGRR